MRPGERISDRYKIIREIGSGGMANVFLAEDLILERQVAVKMMAYNFHNDEASIRRFKREALSTTELTHPNIVNVVDVGEEEHSYIVMEYVEGYDLKEYIKEHYPIPYKKTISIMSQILDAVEYAHRHNIIHRDLKPQNILIDNDDTVKITDFGIAVALSENSITQTNSLLGSVHYISPEQARGSMATKQSDVYSLGILLYELLAGVVPFDGESAVSIALKHFQNDMPSLKQKDETIPQALENVVLKATAKESQHRYSSVREMKNDLITALSPDRSDEKRYEPVSNLDDSTRVLTPITASMANGNKSKREDLTQTRSTAVLEPENKGTSKKKKGKKGIIWTIIILLLLAISFLVFSLTRPQEVTIPNFDDMTQEEAEEKLKELNLVLGEVIEQNHESIETGYVIRTNPEEGSVLREQAEVDLYVSLGQDSVVMEDYEGEMFEEARAKLTSLNFKVEKIEEYNDSIESGVIISQSVSPGDEVIAEETTVELVVSMGPEAYTLKDLTGYSPEGVDEYVNERNISVTITYGSHDTIPEGLVASQSPEPETEVFSGNRISVVISTGPEEPEYVTFSKNVLIEYVEPAEEEPDPEANPEEGEEESETPDTIEEQPPVPNTIQVYVGDAENSIDDLFREFDITENTDLQLVFTVEEGSTASFRIVRDGETIVEESGIGPND